MKHGGKWLRAEAGATIRKTRRLTEQSDATVWMTCDAIARATAICEDTFRLTQRSKDILIASYLSALRRSMKPSTPAIEAAREAAWKRRAEQAQRIKLARETDFL